MEQITLYFTIQVLGENTVYIFSKQLMKEMNGILTGGKTLKKKIIKITFVCERHYPEYQFIKSLHKIITSLFVQKSLKVSQTESF